MDYYYDPETNQLVYREPNQKPPKKKLKLAKGFLTLFAAAILAGAAFGAGYGIAGNGANNVGSFQEAVGKAVEEKLKQSVSVLGLESKTVISASATEIESGTIKVIENLSKAVVSIDTEIRTTSNYFGFGMGAYASAGSGIIIYEDSSDVYIATNNHVIENAKKVTISLDDSTKVPASYVGSDINEDVAVIKVSKTNMIAAGIEDYAIATFANSDNLKVGQDVVAIGNSAGEGKSATKGIISAINKEITVEGKTLNVLQTDAAINPGNSGGALVNMQSEVVGINTAKYSSSYSASEGSVEGMGYAIPSNTVKRLVETMIQASSDPNS
jgi:serine protease Do